MSQEAVEISRGNIERGAEIHPVRTLELTPSPLNPNAAVYSDPLNLHRSFGGNLNLAIGGSLEFSDGTTVVTDGIIGRAIRGEQQQQLDRDMRAQSLAASRVGVDYGGRVRVLGKLIRETEAVRIANAEIRRVDQEGMRRGSGVREQLERRQQELSDFIQTEDLEDEVLQEYNAVIAVDVFLQANPNAGDFQPIEEHLRILQLDPSDVSVKELRAEVRASSRSREFRKYRVITRGSGEGEKHVKGLNELEVEHKAMEAAREQELTAVRERAVVVRRDADRWEKEYSELKGPGDKEEGIARQRIQQYQEVERFLQAHYLPDGQETVRVVHELADAEEARDEVSQLWAESDKAQRYLDQVSGKGGLRRSIARQFDPFRQAREVVDKRVAVLKGRLESLTDPKARLRAPGAPRALIEAVDIAIRPLGININGLPEGQRVLVEAARCLLGDQILVKVDELPPEVVAVVEPVSVPEAAALPAEPVVTELSMPDPLAEPAQPESAALSALTTEQLQQLPKQRMAEAVFRGDSLTIGELAVLNPDRSLDGDLERLLAEADGIFTLGETIKEIKQAPGSSPDIAERIVVELASLVSSLIANRYPEEQNYTFNRLGVYSFITGELAKERLSADERAELEQARRALAVINLIR